MSKYKVGEQLIIIENQHEDVKKLDDMIELKVNKENYSKLTLGIKILEVKFEKPNVTLTYRNVTGDIKKVFAICRDIPNFDEEKVLEKALLKAFQEEIININVTKNQGVALKY